MAMLIGGLFTLAVQIGYQWYLDQHKLPDELVGVVLPKPRGIGAFELVDHMGKPFTMARLKGKWTFMFFGYTHCPDVCPVTMGLMADVFSRFKDRPDLLDQTQGVFVSIDPKRDTEKMLKEYVPYFNKEFIGVTGGVGEVDRFSTELGVGVRVSPPEADGSYQIAHTSAIYLINPQGKFHALFQTQFHNAEKIAKLFDMMIKLFS
ncbi:MAG: SCO family protein [Magnetococcales bacterium]|nr:SCO family protein [Magnetococcales bacterium]MBF0149461.1 SCO family protein [Magnetococcales bacterium]MBF0171876.1 SCO family protein [Magnetococcales bacterium]MBF0632276.1 SCO family protein [Magnetococcales bacterium]